MNRALEPLMLPFMQRALIAGTMVGFLASYFGGFIVQRRMAFMGSGLAHAAFGGVALGLLLNAQPLWIAALFTIVVACAIVWVRERAPIAEDTAIGVFFSVSMALGVVFLAVKKGYAADAFTYLFGSILAVTQSDLLVAGVVVAGTLMTIPLWSSWAYATFDRSLARTDQVPVRRHDYLLNVAMAVVIVIAMKVVGMLLIAAFLVLPAATARLLSGTFRAMTVVSVLLGIASAFIGLYGSYFADLPSGPCIVLLQAALFASALAYRRMVGAE